jgi:hypothetical protein
LTTIGAHKAPAGPWGHHRAFVTVYGDIGDAEEVIVANALHAARSTARFLQR